MNLSIVSDEISRDFLTAVEILNEWHVSNVELRELRTERVPQITEEEKKELLRYLVEYPIKVSAISPGICKYPLDTPNIEQVTMNLLHRSIDFAEEVGTDKIIVFGFRKPKHLPSESLPKKGLILLQKIVDYADKRNKQILLENHSGCYVNTNKALYNAIQEIERPSLRINWDPNNSLLYSRRPYKNEYRLLKNWISNIHIKDTKIVKNHFIRVPIGEGDAGWNNILKTLINEGYKGFYTIETHYKPHIRNTRIDLEKFRWLYSAITKECKVQ